MATANPDQPSTRECPRCGARWLNGQLYWATGKPGSELDLAGLVCNTIQDPACINPCGGMEGGETWAMRQARSQLFNEQMQQQAQQAGSARRN
jgi:hypothetical protein